MAAAAAVEEVGGDAAIVLSEGAEPAIQMDARFTQAGARRLVDDKEMGKLFKVLAVAQQNRAALYPFET